MINFRKILAILLCSSYILASAQEVNFMTYNIRYDNPEDGIHNWHERKAEVVEFLSNLNPDILGIQEGIENQVKYIDEQLETHNYVGVGRKDGKTAGEYTALYYNTAKFDVVESGTFWLSTTPETVSVGWDAALPRICTWARLRDVQNGDDIMAFNTHFDHRGVKARRKATKLIYRKIKNLNPDQLPFVLMGDLNLPPDSKSIRFLQRKLIDPTVTTSLEGPKGTSCGFDAEEETGRRIDYIFISDFGIRSYLHLDPRRKIGNHHLSDHLPVMAKLERN